MTTKSGAVALGLDTLDRLAGRTSPTELAASEYAACFRGAMALAQVQLKLPPLPAETSVQVFTFGDKFGMGNVQAGLELHVPGWSKTDIKALAKRTHAIYPFSPSKFTSIRFAFTSDSSQFFTVIDRKREAIMYAGSALLAAALPALCICLAMSMIRRG